MKNCENLFDRVELILVEDCSGDNTWDEIEKIAEADNRVKAIQLSRNCGQHVAISAGLKETSGDWVVVMDCDLQDDPADIPALYAKACEGYDVVSIRRMERHDSFCKRASSWLFTRVFDAVSGVKHDEKTANFRIMSRRVVNVLLGLREENRIITYHLPWIGFERTSIEGHHHERYSGKSSYTFRKLLRHALQIIFTTSNRPLVFSALLGSFVSGMAFLTATYLVFRKLFSGVGVDGWTSLMVSLWFIGGVIIFNLGIIGIYIGKLFDASKARPLYVIARRKNLDK